MMSRSFLRLASVTVLFAGSSSIALAAPFEAHQVKAVDNVVEEAIAAGSLPGAALAIAQDGKLIVSRTFGVSDTASNSPVTEATLFRLGSISKFVTAAAVMHLIETGKLRLTDRVAVVLKGRKLSQQLGEVTVEQLLNHTSGLADITFQEMGDLVGRKVPVADSNVLAVLQRPAKSEPGTTWSYNNVGFRLLSWIIEDSKGRRFNDYIVSELAPRLKLKSIQPCDLAQASLSRGYIVSDKKLVEDLSYSVRGLLGDGGLCATAQDLALIPARLRQNDWINSHSLAAMVKPTVLPDGALADYGLGVRRGLIGKQPMWGHSGSGLAGGWAALAYYPERRITIAVLGNGSGGAHDAITLQAKIAATLMDELQLSNEEIDSLIRAAMPIAFGTEESKVCFAWAPAGVTRRSAGSTAPPRPMLHQGAGVFARADYPLDRYVIQVAKGRPLAHRVYYDGYFAELLRPARTGAC